MMEIDATPDNPFSPIEHQLRTNDPALTNLMLPNRRNIPRSVLEALAANHVVHTVHLEMTDWSDEHCSVLQDSGGLSNSVTSLFLSRNLVTSVGLPALCTAVLGGVSRLRTLNLSKNPLGSDVEVLGNAVAHSVSLTSLNLNETKLSSEGVVALVNGLRMGGAQRCRDLPQPEPLEIQMQSCGITDDAAVHIAQLVAEGRVNILLLNKNQIGDHGVSVLAQSCVDGVLTRLSLMSNLVSDEGAKSFAQVIKANGALRWLNLSHNHGVGDGSVAVLLSNLELNTQLNNLDVGRTSVSAEMSARLHECLSKESIRKRQHVAFRPIAKLLLRSAGAGTSSSSSSLLYRRLPHMVLLKIFECAAPEGFILRDEFSALVQSLLCNSQRGTV